MGNKPLPVQKMSAQPVYLREMLACDEFKHSQKALTLALGKDIGGTPTFTDLAKFCGFEDVKTFEESLLKQMRRVQEIYETLFQNETDSF